MTEAKTEINQKTAQQIQQWLIAWLSKELKIEPTEIEIDEPFVNLGLSSRQAVILTGELEDWLGFEVEVGLAWEYPTIQQLAQYLSQSKPQ